MELNELTLRCRRPGPGGWQGLARKCATTFCLSSAGIGREESARNVARGAARASAGGRRQGRRQGRAPIGLADDHTIATGTAAVPTDS